MMFFLVLILKGEIPLTHFASIVFLSDSGSKPNMLSLVSGFFHSFSKFLCLVM